MQGGERYNSIGDHLKKEFGRKMVKLSIDAGFTCPNRDGSLSYGGCAFCSAGGSGELASHVMSDMSFVTGPCADHAANPNEDLSTDHAASLNEDLCTDPVAKEIHRSIDEQIEKLSSKWPDAGYIAYFQSFTNTYASIEKLRSLYYEALSDPRVEGIAIATRPDCLGEDVLDLLEEINERHYLWVELGLQSMHDDTLKAMNTCYSLADYDTAAESLISRGIKVVTHVILGLPDETQDMMLETVKHVCERPVFGIKLHLMNIVKTSRLYASMPGYIPFDSIEDYVDLVVRCLEIIPEAVTIHRLTGDVPRKILVSPEWSYRKRTILNMINKELKDRDTCQGAAPPHP